MHNASDTTKSIHLSASAGSGKTRALKERYLALLDALEERGLNLDQAVAITFTDKAAAEIKERVMRDLSEAMLKTIIRGQQELRISTIHSFCMNLLKRYPLEAGLPPDFGILDSRDQSAKIEKAVESVLEESDRDRETMAPLSHLGADELLSRLAFLLQQRSRIKRMEIDAGGRQEFLRAVRHGSGLEQNETELRELVSGPSWRMLLAAMEALLRSQPEQYEACMGREHLQLSEVTDMASALRMVGLLAPVYFTAGGEPRKNPFIPKKRYFGDRPAYESLYFQVQDLLGRFRSLQALHQAGREAACLLTLFERAEETYQESKLREGLLDFDDLEIYAYRLLRGIDSPDILYWLDRKVLHFLVDEFQDTSDIQWAILDRLTEEIFAGQGTDKRMPATLFVVGDEKQSIYRFREANYRLIRNVRTKMETNIPAASREIRTLDRNYRSAYRIIETANAVFGSLWESYQPSAVERKTHAGSVRLIELPPPAAGGTSPEAGALAREIRALIAGETIVYEQSAGGTWTERPVGYGDCAVLIQSRTRLKDYEAALQEHRIPYQVVGGIGFFEEDEIQSLVNLLFFLWNRDDELALAAALRSRLFGLSDGDIFTCVNGGGSLLDGLAGTEPGAASMIRSWMNLAGLMPLAPLLHRIVQDSAAYIRFGRGNAQAIFNIDKLLDTAREFDRRGYTTLQDFVEWVRNVQRTEQREATADVSLPESRGAVSILTVHKAKGLEYPVIFLPGMNQQPRSLTAGPLAIIDDFGDRVRLAIRDQGNPVYDYLWEQERTELMREHQRLFYVAMTRARDHLVMLGTLNDGKTAIKPQTWLSYVHAAAPQPLFTGKQVQENGTVLYETPELLASPRGEALQTGSRLLRPDTDSIDIEAILRNLSSLPRSESPAWKRPTDFILHEDRESGPLPGGEGTVSPLTRGSILHGCLEAFTKTGGYDLNRLAEEHPDVAELPQERKRKFLDDAETVLDAVLHNQSYSWIFDSHAAAWSELPFLHEKDNTIVSGVIDRVVIRDGKGFVIDYKAILPENQDALESWLDHYRPQIAIYCDAVRELFGLPVVEGYLLFLDSNTLSRCISC
jgi:ATP-dependent helicase/nuclease subunit A